MGKVVFRSLRKKRKQIISVSVDNEVLDFLDTQANKSQFICDLVRKIMKEQKPIEEQQPIETVETQLPWTDEMKQLWTERRRLVNEYGSRFEGSEGRWGLEDRWLELQFGDSGYLGEQEEFKEAASEFRPDVLKYFEKVWNLPTDPNLRSSYIERIYEKKEAKQQQRIRIKCGGDPEEIVWRDLTRWDIVCRFEKDRYYSVQAVAAELGISYDQAYKNIVPLLKFLGFRVG